MVVKDSVQSAGYQTKTSVTWNQDRTKIMSEPETENWKKILHANGIYKRHDMKIFDSFHRFPIIDPYDNMTTTREYAFFVKPDLHIFDGDASRLNPELANVPFFVDLVARGYNKTVLKQLQYSIDTAAPFINILSNRMTSNIDLEDINAEEVTTNENYFGSKLRYRRSSEKSDEEYDFSVEFEDTRYLEIYLMFKAYDEYERLKAIGRVTPPSKSYIENKILHDVMAVYKFIVGEDGETIIHYSKLWYVYPNNVPRSALSDVTQDGNFKFTIQFKGQWMTDLEPETIYEFNNLSTNNIPAPHGVLPLWDPDIQAVSGEVATRPYIVKERHGVGTHNYIMYKLKWGY